METKLKFKGTPGPWEIADIDDGWKDCVSARSANGNVIAVAETDNKEAAEADARLIAAAPDMLEVLQDLVNTWMSPDKSIGEMCYSIENAQRIIKKALEE